MGSRFFLPVYHVRPSDFAERRPTDKGIRNLYNKENKRKAAKTMYESILYFDPQTARPVCFCPVCGGECYAPSRICIRCERRAAP